jgi:hypothetical protein
MRLLGAQTPTEEKNCSLTLGSFCRLSLFFQYARGKGQRNVEGAVQAREHELLTKQRVIYFCKFMI